MYDVAGMEKLTINDITSAMRIIVEYLGTSEPKFWLGQSDTWLWFGYIRLTL